jgi:hypothetical protein
MELFRDSECWVTFILHAHGVLPWMGSTKKSMHGLPNRRCVLQDKAALTAHEGFLKAMKKLDDDITVRNSGDSKIRAEKGARGLPYTLLRPHSEEGVTMRGVPCSTSI